VPVEVIAAWQPSAWVQTRREQEVLEYLLQGLTSKAIANRMNISPNTVKAFLRMIMIKTGVSSRAAMVGKIIMAQPQ